MKANFPILQLSEGILNDQVYHSIRDAILEGRLQKNMKLPSSRTLAEMMSVSRNTVLTGLERLIDEGYLVTKKGSGTYVSDSLPEHLTFRISNKTNVVNDFITQPSLSDAVSSLLPRWKNYHSAGKHNKMFSVGVGCLDLFPHQAWGRALGKAWRNSYAELSRYSDTFGYLPLREALAQYIRSTRGVNCIAEQVMIVNGTQQAINLTAMTLLNAGDCVLMDDPGYDGAFGVFQSYGINVQGIASDEEGMLVNHARQTHTKVQLIYTAPSHQFPLGETLSLSRRLSLLEWAQRDNFWIFEDDYNGEYRYRSRSIQSLQGLDQFNRVIYSGTFSKMFYSGFRLAFIVIPHALIEPFKVMKHYADSCNSYLEQAALAHFIQEGEYAKYVRKVRKACLERQKALIDAISLYLSDVFTVNSSDSGIHAIAWLQDGWEIEKIIAICRQKGLGVQPLSRYTNQPLKKHALLFGYAAHTPKEIHDQIQGLADAIKCSYGA